MIRVSCLAFLLIIISASPVFAQNIDLGSNPGTTAQPINITANQAIEWRQADQEVIASGDAKAVRGAVTVQADQLVAHYRKKTRIASAPTQTEPNDPEDVLNSGSTELYQLDAIGHVHIFTPTDNAYGDKAVYSLDDAVLVLTGHNLKLTTPSDIVTARDSIEYYSVKDEAVARGAAMIVTNDGRSIAADVLIGYLAPASANSVPGSSSTDNSLIQSSQLKKVEAIGHVTIKTTSDTVTGQVGVYLPQSGLARLGGNVHITQGQNMLTGNDALVNMKTGVATLLAASGGQVAGSIIPNSATGK
jgi:lipopolysaccharide export system protein LptA